MTFDRNRYLLISAGAALLFLLGAAVWLSSLNTAKTPPWAIFVTNFTFFLGITQGALVMALLLRLTRCQWAQPFYRLSEIIAVAFFPIALAMLLNIVLGGDTLFFWAKQSSAPWLGSAFFLTRNVLLFLTFYGLALALFFSNPPASPGDEHPSNRRVIMLGVALVVAFVIFETVVAWDLGMTLTPNYVSSIFPVDYWFGYLRAGLALLVLTMFFLKTVFGIELFDRKGFLNLGHMLLALTIVWFYFWWSTFFPVWYANIPQETQFLYIRIFGPYKTLYGFLMISAAVVPFIALLFTRLRQSPIALSAISFLILIGLWIERYITILPALIRQRMTAYTPIIGLTNLAVALGIMGGFLLLLLVLLRLYPKTLNMERGAEF